MLLKDQNQDVGANDLFRFLRAETDSLHRRLEKDLHLLTPPSRQRFVYALRKFLGFHRVWEASLRTDPSLDSLLQHRSRVRHLETDLAALGLSAAEIAAAPPCETAASLGRTLETAAGSLYVMEGSTLGGAAIGRALSKQTWTPAQGLQYFTPPGRDVHADWRALRDWVQATWPEAAWPQIAAGARATFATLDVWIGGSTPAVLPTTS